MEPKILIIGRTLPVLEKIEKKLKSIGRSVYIANSKVMVERALNRQKITFTTMGAGMDEDVRKDMVDFIRSRKPDMEVHLVDRTAHSKPADMVAFTNELALTWKEKNELASEER